MESGGDRTEATGSSEAIMAELEDWQAVHPQASFAEIEAAVEERVAAVRGRLLAAALRRRARQDAAAPDAAWQCVGCGRRLQRRGQATGEVLVRGSRAVALVRAYGACPTCGVGLFPPG
jgi:hypothetical protein